MHPRTLALIFAAAALAAGCASKEAPPEAAAAPAPAAAKAAEPPPPAKPECPPEPAAKKKAPAKKGSKKDKDKTAETPPADCEPAKPKTAAAAPAPAAKVVETTPAPSKDGTAGKPCNPCTVKSRDGSFSGEVYGTIPAGSKWAQLRIGMEQPEVERLLGVSNDVHAYPTGKAFIPFYFGSDSTRYEVRYRGQGSVSYTGGSWGGGRGVLMMINYDPKM